MKAGVITAKTRENALARLHEGGFVARPKNMSGAQWTGALAQLDSEGFVFDYRTGCGHNNGTRLVSSPVNCYAGTEKAAEPPIRVKCRSRVFGEGGRVPLPGSGSATSSQVEKEEPRTLDEAVAAADAFVSSAAAGVEPAISLDCDTAAPTSDEGPKSAIEPAGPHAPAACDPPTAPAPAAPTPRPHGPVPFAGHRIDFELVVITRCLHLIDSLEPAARIRVAAYVAARYL